MFLLGLGVNLAGFKIPDQCVHNQESIFPFLKAVICCPKVIICITYLLSKR